MLHPERIRIYRLMFALLLTVCLLGCAQTAPPEKQPTAAELSAREAVAAATLRICVPGTIAISQRR
jgi:hypothetical protein